MICVAQGPMLRRSLCLAYRSALAILKLLINFKQGTSHLYFALGLENYIAGADGLASKWKGGVWKGRV